MFSAAATMPVTGTRTPAACSADITAMTAPPAAMSVFIGTMASRGLSESPPESKVMPLPTRTTCGARVRPPGR